MDPLERIHRENDYNGERAREESFSEKLRALDAAIINYAADVLETPDTLNDALKSLFVKRICQMSPEEIELSSSKSMIEKVRECCFDCLISQPANVQAHEPFRLTNYSDYTPHPLVEVLN